MKIAVTGSRGRLGSVLITLGCIPLIGDIRGSELDDALRCERPDVIIHCAAMTDVDKCETEVIEAASKNVAGTKSLLNRFNGKVVYISTDYIFDGVYGPYTEEAPPNPLGIYGWSKLGGEIVTRSHSADNLIVRTTMLYDARPGNFVTTVAAKLRAGDTVFLPHTLYGSPTHIPALAADILTAINRGEAGILNLAGDVVLSRYQLGLNIANALNIDTNRVQSSSLAPGIATRPLRAGLKVGKAKRLGILTHANYQDQLKEAVNGMETMEAR